MGMPDEPATTVEHLKASQHSPATLWHDSLTLRAGRQDARRRRGL